MYDEFVKAIQEKRLVSIIFKGKDGGRRERKCVPFDFGPSRRANDKSDRYHFKDLDSPNSPHILSILPSQLIEIEMLNETFEPGDYVTWTPVEWFLERDWGQYS